MSKRVLVIDCLADLKDENVNLTEGIKEDIECCERDYGSMILVIDENNNVIDFYDDNIEPEDVRFCRDLSYVVKLVKENWELKDKLEEFIPKPIDQLPEELKDGKDSGFIGIDEFGNWYYVYYDKFDHKIYPFEDGDKFKSDQINWFIEYPNYKQWIKDNK